MMKIEDAAILAVKPGHDGALAFIQGGQLRFSLEAENDNGVRYSEVTSDLWFKGLSMLPAIPNVLAQSGWSIGSPEGPPVGAGYSGLDVSAIGMASSSRRFTSSHERSHVMCAYGMSPFEQGRPCYALVWEGHIGSFYMFDGDVRVRKLVDVLPFPGVRYAFLYGLADPGFHFSEGDIRLSDAGKLMALTGFAQGASDSDGERVVEQILSGSIAISDLDKARFRWSRYHNCGVQDPSFASVAKSLSGKLFEIFETGIRPHVRQKLPLLLSGGCALNCDWNSRWESSGLFSDVFVPPCANDSGSAIGTAVDAQHHFTGNAKVEWSVYCGELPERDMRNVPGFTEMCYDPHAVATELAAGRVIGWVRGRYEVGPRALGARSMLASAQSASMLARLNEIKRREQFRPIAPVCTEEAMPRYFSPGDPSPYMLKFRKVISAEIPAVTHVDGSARPQSISRSQNPALHNLLDIYGRQAGSPVLCNTSLNFNGRGFVNKLSDLRRLALEQGMDGFVFEDRFFLKEFGGTSS